MPGVPTDAEVIKIVNEWNARVDALYRDPQVADVAAVCIVNTECEKTYSTQIADMKALHQHVVGGSPVSVTRIRSVARKDDSLIVSYWTSPIGGQEMVGPDGTVQSVTVPDGLGVTLLLVPFPGDKQFPWRATQETVDPT